MGSRERLARGEAGSDWHMRKERLRMKGIGRRAVSILLTVVFVIAAFPLMSGSSVHAAEQKDCYSKLESYSIDPDLNKGLYLVPDAPGKYPVVFLFHGSGGIKHYKRDILKLMNLWVAHGYIDPVILIMPEIDQVLEPNWGITDFRNFVSEGHFKTLMDQVKSGEFTDKADVSVGMTAAGYSMGGAEAMYVALTYKDDILNIGAASPANVLYGGEDYGYVPRAKLITFTEDPEAHFFMGYGLKEADYFGENAKRYYKAFSENKGDSPNDFVFYDRYNGAHAWGTFKREIFAFFYYLKFDELPTDEVIEDSFKAIPKPKYKPNDWNQIDGKWYYMDADSRKLTNQWVKGYWLGSDGVRQEDRRGTWKHNSRGWWFEDSKGWYAKNCWQQIDGKWYYFDRAGYMESRAYRRGYYLTKDGAWDGKGAVAGWTKDGSGWKYLLSDGKPLSGKWMKIDGAWYCFHEDGTAAQNEFVKGWWLGDNCICSDSSCCKWHKSSKGWWYGDDAGWYAKNKTYVIDGKSYTFGADGYLK